MTENLLAQLERLPEFLAAHILLTLGALALGIAISLPLAFMSLRSRPVRAVSLTAAGITQTIPSLALLAFMVVAFGLFGTEAALIGLTVYSILPILRNTITGIEGVDPAVLEAARGVGMTPRQVLFKIQLPLAAPMIIAGIRIATVWVVGIATLGTPVGAPCLGEFIFAGLHLDNRIMVLTGIISAALLAIVLDQLIWLMETGAQRRSKVMVGGGVVGLASIFVLAMTPRVVETIAAQPDDGMKAVEGGAYVVGAKTFTEQYILAELITDQLKAAGMATEKKTSLGSTAIFNALANGDIDIYVDYTGTLWANQLKREASTSRQQVLEEVAAWVQAKHEVKLLGALGFENAYAIAMRDQHAAQLGIETIADLALHAPSLRIGGDYEWFGRPEWPAVRDAYGLNFAEQVSYDSTLMYEAIRAGEVDVISAFSTDGRIAAYDLEVLEDPRESLPPYDAVLLLSPRAAADPRVSRALAPLLDSIDDELMRQANMLVDLQNQTVEEAAAFVAEQVERHSLTRN